MKGRLVNYGIRTLVGLASLALAFASADAATPQYKWKIAHIRPAGTAIDKDVHGFVDRVAKESGGRIVIEVYPASQLGDYTVVQGALVLFVAVFVVLNLLIDLSYAFLDPRVRLTARESS